MSISGNFRKLKLGSKKLLRLLEVLPIEVMGEKVSKTLFYKDRDHRWQTQGLRAESSPPPCFYPAAALSSLPLVKEQLHL